MHQIHTCFACAFGFLSDLSSEMFDLISARLSVPNLREPAVFPLHSHTEKLDIFVSATHRTIVHDFWPATATVLRCCTQHPSACAVIFHGWCCLCYLQPVAVVMANTASLARLLWLLLLLRVACCLDRQLPVGKSSLVTDLDMDIHRYEVVVHDGKQAAAVKLWLRFLCTEDSGASPGNSRQQLHGFMAVLPLSTEGPKWSANAPHLDSLKLRHKLNITVSSSTGITNFVELGASNLGLIRIAANLSGPGPFRIEMGGSTAVISLPQSTCPQQEQPGTPKLAGLWNVLTTTSMSSLTADRLAYLVLQHTQYHRNLGFDGTILRSNIHESMDMLNISSIKEAIASKELIIWPWEHEHVAGWSTHFWQRPKHQLTLLGSYGRNTSLSFIDFDEFMVLQNGRSIQCGGRPLLDPDPGGPRASFKFARYQAKSCPHDPGDLPCWQDGQSATSTEDKTVYHSLCPMSTMHGKMLLRADMVDSVTVHFTVTGGEVTSHHNYHVNETCAYLLHFFSLVEGRRPGITSSLIKLPPVLWRTAGDGQHGVLWPQGLSKLSHEACKVPKAEKNALKGYEAFCGNASCTAGAAQGRAVLQGTKGPGASYPQEKPG